MSSAAEMYQTERSKRAGRGDPAMDAARDEMARQDAERAEKRKLRTGRCSCGKTFDYIRGHGRPPIKCSSCRTKPKTRAIARVLPVTPEVAVPLIKVVDAEPTNGNSVAPPHLTSQQFAVALRARIAGLDYERKLLESLLQLNEADA